MAWYHGVACPKPESRKRTKGRKDRRAATVEKAVRAACVERDGYCRVIQVVGSRPVLDRVMGPSWRDCEGPSAWAHLHSRRRSKTRGMAPEARHDTAHTLMLCRLHHDQLDGRETPRISITAVTRKGADGPLTFRHAR